jgi:hypothetical protein
MDSTVERAIAAHLGSRDVARVIYGTIIGLALVVALGQHPPTATQAVGAIVGTAVAVGLAEIYSEFVGAEARERRQVTRAELRQLTGEAAAVTFGAIFPAVFFVLAAVDVIEVDTAFTLAKWTGLVLISGYAFVAARLAGSRNRRALAHAVVLGAIGGALIALKALLH